MEYTLTLECLLSYALWVFLGSSKSFKTHLNFTTYVCYAQLRAGGSLFFLLALAANGGKSWIWNVDFFCSPWSTFSLQPNRMCYMNVFSANFWDGCSSVYLFFFRLTLFVGVEAFDCRKEISDMCNRAAIIFSFKGLLVLLSLYGYLGIQYGYLILYLVAKKDEER